MLRISTETFVRNEWLSVYAYKNSEERKQDTWYTLKLSLPSSRCCLKNAQHINFKRKKTLIRQYPFFSANFIYSALNLLFRDKINSPLKERHLKYIQPGSEKEKKEETQTVCWKICLFIRAIIGYCKMIISY